MPVDTHRELREENPIEGNHVWYQRELIVLLWLTVLTVALFVIAYFVTTAFRRQQASLGDEYFRRGALALSAKQANEAVTDFRIALGYAPEKREYRLRLAQALVLANRDKEALAHFKDLWESEPGDGEINLELARLAALDGNMADALRFFHGAIYGLWDKDPEGNRQEARLELIQFLLREHANTQAQSELLALSANLPVNTNVNAKVASLFAKAGDELHALQFYRSALHLDRKNQAALIGAAQASLALGNYKNAVGYFKAASSEQPLPSEVQGQAQTAELVLQVDPYQRGLPAAERRARTLAAFAQAGDRLKACLGSQGPQPTAPGQSLSTLQADYSEWSALQRQVNPQTLRENSDLMDKAMDLVYRVEQDTEQLCGEPVGGNMALLLLARHGLGAER
jgi:predicted Zn-dependent protease